MRTTIYLTDELHKSLKMWAVEHDQSMSEVITMALKTTMTMVGIKGKPLKASEVQLLKKAIDEKFPDSLNKPRGEIHGEDYI